MLYTLVLSLVNLDLNCHRMYVLCYLLCFWPNWYHTVSKFVRHFIGSTLAIELQQWSCFILVAMVINKIFR